MVISVFSIKGIGRVVHVSLVKQRVMPELDGMNIYSNPTKNLMQKLERINIIQLVFQNDCFRWTIILNAPKNVKTRMNLETSSIALWKPDLN